ncbi:MAG: putative glycoside hydrolase, partial [Terriglobales bacterium]
GRQPRLAWFYKPPVGGTTAEYLARHCQLIILTHADEPYMAELRQVGYGGPILQYIAANEVEGPGPYANAHAACDARYPTYQRTVSDRVGDFCAKIHPHEGWFLHNLRGARLYTRHLSSNGIWRTVYAMNPGSRGWRGFLIRRLRQYRHLGYDGFFLDNVDLSRAGLLRQQADRGGVAEYPSDAALEVAMLGYLRALRKAFVGVPLWANLTHDPGRIGEWTPYLENLDGIMIEDFALGWRGDPLTPAAARVQMQDARAALGAGKGVLVVVQGRANEPQRQKEGIAAWRELVTATPTLTSTSRRPFGLYYRYADAFRDDYRTLN